MPLWSAVVIAQVVSLTLGDRTEARARMRTDSPTYYDVETRPIAQLDVTDRRTSWSLRYVPVLTRLSLGSELEQTLFLQAGRSELSYRWRRTTLRWVEDGTYGQQSFQVSALSLAPAASGNAGAPPGGTTPGGMGTANQLGYLRETLVTGSLNSTATLEHAFSRRVSGGVSGGYNLTGGLDDASRERLPWLRGPNASASVGVRSSRVDTWSTRVNGYLMTASNGREPWLVWGEEEWEHRWTRRWTGRLTGGAASTSEAPLLGVASASASWRTPLAREDVLVATGSLRIAPVVDARTALVDERVTAELGGAWTRGAWAWTARGAWTRSADRGDESSVEIRGGSVGVAWEVTEGVGLEVGGRATQYAVGGGTWLPVDWAGYGALRLTDTWTRL